MNRADVVVVGAGLAGLIAARDLREVGVDVVLLEARNRVGGRTWTTNFDAAGTHVDLGAEWVAPACHSAVVQVAERYGISLAFGEYADVDDVVEHPGSEAYERALAQLDADAAAIDFERTDWYRAVEHLDVSMADYVDKLDLPEDARSRLLAESFALMGANEHDYSVINLLHEVSGFGSAHAAFVGESARLDGGADGISRAIARELGDVVRLEHRVTAVGPHEDGVVVSGENFTITASAVIIALPVNVLPDLRLDIPLGPEAVRVIAERHIGKASKGWATVSGDVGALHSGGWPDAIEVYAVPGTRRPAVARFSLGEPSHDAALDRAWTAMSARHPFVGDELDTLSHDWMSDEFAQGAWHAARPGQALGWHELSATAGPFFFAGGDISRRWFGWMDGAITSGADAALRAAAYVGGRPVPDVRG